MSLPIPMGDDFATATGRPATRKARSPAVCGFAKLEIIEQAAIVAEVEAASGAMFDLVHAVDGQPAGNRELPDLHRRCARSASYASPPTPCRSHGAPYGWRGSRVRSGAIRKDP